MANNRVFYAIQQVAVKDNSALPGNAVATWNAKKFPYGPMASGLDQVWGKWEAPRGMQSVGMSTTFNIEEAFELGQVEVYEQSERQPEIEYTLSRVLDGTKALWFMLVDPSGSNNNLTGKTASFRADVILNIYADTAYRADGTPVSACLGSGMYISGMTYTYPVDGPCTEEATLVGNDKIWASFDASVEHQDESVLTWPQTGWEEEAPRGVPSGVFGWTNIGGVQEVAGGTAAAGTIIMGSGIQRREEVDIRRSVLPGDIPGVATFTSSGILAWFFTGVTPIAGNAEQTVQIGDANTDDIVEHIQGITCSVDLSRRDIFEVGSKRPYVKVVDYPVEVTCSVEVLTSNGDLIDARALDSEDNTIANNTIIIRTVEGLQVDLGASNRLMSIDVGGGEAGGGDMTITYNYRSFGTFNVTHDAYNPNHRIIIMETGNSRFNQGAPSWKRSDFFGA